MVLNAENLRQGSSLCNVLYYIDLALLARFGECREDRGIRNDWTALSGNGLRPKVCFP
jgi:hypothetical protein